VRSDLIVVSWWSNCLGLKCLDALAGFVDLRTIHVLQVGKSEEQKQVFRQRMPAQVVELDYPPDLSHQHSVVIETVVRDLLPDSDGLWFLDHDWFVHENPEPWLAKMDRKLSRRNRCLCHRRSSRSTSITTPAFWLAPSRLPADVPSFHPTAGPADSAGAGPVLRIPEYDTLILAMQHLRKRRLVATYSRRSMPACTHLGGLSMLTTGIPPVAYQPWFRAFVGRFADFFDGCSDDWLATEDPALLRRLKEFRLAVSGQSDSEWDSTPR